MHHTKLGSPPEELLRNLRDTVQSFLEAQTGSTEDIRDALIDLRRAVAQADRYLGANPKKRSMEP